MQDTITKGTGNSRSLRSVPNFLTLYPTYEAFAAALVGGTLPIDLGPLNAAGVQQMGMALNKANLLKDATAALYGMTSSAVPDDVFRATRGLISTAQSTANGRLRVESGSYVGTGKEGKDNPTILNFSFAPWVVFLFIADYNHVGIIYRPATWGTLIYANSGATYPIYGIHHVEWNGNIINLWATTNNRESGPMLQMNMANRTYRYIAIG